MTGRGRYAAAVPVRQRVLVLAFVLWTAFVWANRISNTLRSDESTGAKTFSTVLSIVLLLFGLAVLIVTVRAWRRGLRDTGAGVLVAAGAVTVVVWVVRVPQILLADHTVGFKAVHVVLGLVSIALAVAVVRVGLAARRALQPRPPI